MISFNIDLPDQGPTSLSVCSWEFFEIIKAQGITMNFPTIFDIFQTIYWQIDGRICTYEEICDFVNALPERMRRIKIEDPSEDFKLYVTYSIKAPQSGRIPY
jgi:hypothetical protein